MIPVYFKRLHPEARLPLRATPGSIGLDLFAHLLTEHGAETKSMIPSRTVKAIPTGLAIEPPQQHLTTQLGPLAATSVAVPTPQYLVQVVSRSGMALRQTLWVANAPGIIDPDYRGELVVLLYNGSGHETQWIRHGDRIAQLILVRAEFAIPSIVDELGPTSERGAKGLGSTGR